MNGSACLRKQANGCFGFKEDARQDFVEAIPFLNFAFKRSYDQGSTLRKCGLHGDEADETEIPEAGGAADRRLLCQCFDYPAALGVGECSH
jgi:hypothetical protein